MLPFRANIEFRCGAFVPRSRHRITSAFLLAIAVLLAQALCPAPLQAEPSERPNILLIMADDLGFSDLGCYGSKIETPNLDSLAKGGLRFNQFYNTAKCHSSRICLLTGLYMFQAGNTKLDKAVTIAEVLGQSGYQTMMSGKWHLNDEPTNRAIRKGDMKLVAPRGGSWELYDLADDRSEMNDLTNSKPKMAAELRQLWRRVAEQIEQAPEKLRRPLTGK
jgi:arylsulfatase A-like enzyme